MERAAKSVSSTQDVVNRVERKYDGLGQLMKERTSGQNVGLDSSGNRTATGDGGWTEVAYGYDFSTASNYSRLQSVAYTTASGPGDNTVYYDYTGLDAAVSRVSWIRKGGEIVETYAYLGLGTIVQRQRPEVAAVGDAELTLDVTLDRFGRAGRYAWTLSGEELDGYAYGYDAGSNVVYRKNEASAGLSVSCLPIDASPNEAYDGLNRAARFAVGELEAGGWGVLNRSADVRWSYNSEGKPAKFSSYDAQGTRISDPDLPSAPAASGTESRRAALGEQATVYDPWGRVVKFTSTRPTGSHGFSSTAATYKVYDALGRLADTAVQYKEGLWSGSATTRLIYGLAGKVFREIRYEGGQGHASYNLRR